MVFSPLLAEPPQDFDKTSFALRTALHYDPSVEVPLQKLIELYRSTARTEELLALYQAHLAQYPQDAPAPSAAAARAAGWTFPFLYDESQAVTKAYSAACTPDFFLFDSARRLVYRGQLDDSRPGRGDDRPGRGTLDGADLRAALDAVLAGQPVNPDQKPSIGCNIKWKPGNEPAYF